MILIKMFSSFVKSVVYHSKGLAQRRCFSAHRHGKMPCSEVTDSTSVSPVKKSRTEKSNESSFSFVLKFAKLTEHATTPTRGSAKAAGFDLYSAYDYSIAPMDKAIVKTDLQIAVPAGCYGRVAPRSGLAAKHFIDVGAGVVDEDYRGNVGVVLFNFGKETFQVKKETEWLSWCVNESAILTYRNYRPWMRLRGELGALAPLGGAETAAVL